MSAERVTFKAIRNGVATEIAADAIEICLPDGLRQLDETYNYLVAAGCEVLA